MSRTALVTVASIVAVLIAGSFAMGANLGLIGGSDGDATVGQFDLVDTATAAGAGSAGGSAEATASLVEPGWTAQDYDVGAAGTVSLRWSASELVLADLRPSAGWATQVDRTGMPTTLSVTFTSAGTVFEYTATLQADGSVQADVKDRTPASPPTASSGGFSEREHEEREHEEREHESYEGGEEDD